METKKNPVGKKFLVLAISLLLFVFSLVQPAFYTGEKHDDFPGWACLFWGWLYFGYTYSWLGNPALFISGLLLLFRNPLPAIIGSAITLILMLSFLAETEALVDEGGRMEEITGLGTGFWSWVLSAATILFTAIYFLIKQRKNDREFTK